MARGLQGKKRRKTRAAYIDLYRKPPKLTGKKCIPHNNACFIFLYIANHSLSAF
jgi:hypothetical protein